MFLRPRQHHSGLRYLPPKTMEIKQGPIDVGRSAILVKFLEQQVAYKTATEKTQHQISLSSLKVLYCQQAYPMCSQNTEYNGDA